MVVELLTDRGPSCLPWTGTFFSYGVELFYAPMTSHLVMGDEARVLGPQRVLPAGLAGSLAGDGHPDVQGTLHRRSEYRPDVRVADPATLTSRSPCGSLSPPGRSG
jgi:hypothetical protein